MDEMPRQKRSLELTTKGKVLVGVVVVLIIGAIIFFVVMNNKNNENNTLEDARLAITVTPDKSSGASMTLSPGNETTTGLSVGGTATLTYAFDKETDSKVRWIISDTSVAKEENGVLTALKGGTVEIYAVAVDNEEIISNTVSLRVNE